MDLEQMGLAVSRHNDTPLEVAPLTYGDLLGAMGALFVLP
jgi:hypothetical protein